MSNPFQKPDEAHVISEINVVPLADVSLVLLIILLLMSPMMAQSMLHVKTAGEPKQDEHSYNLPEPPPAVPEMVLVVDLGPKGIAVGGQFFAHPGEFISYMREELGRRSDRKVFLAPHPDTPHGQVVFMLERIKDCGAESVALVQTQEQ